MKLPNAHLAFVDIAKIRDYCLSAGHAEGRHKARVFQSVLGIIAKDAPLLHAAILKAALEQDATQAESDQYGVRYIVDFDLAGRDAISKIRTGWIIRANEDFPRLTTCYVL